MNEEELRDVAKVLNANNYQGRSNWSPDCVFHEPHQYDMFVDLDMEKYPITSFIALEDGIKAAEEMGNF